MTQPTLRIAVPSPLRRLFDYLPPTGEQRALLPGQRIRVPFGRTRLVGVIVAVGVESEVPSDKLRPALELLDERPLLPESMLRLLAWACDYYHHLPGEVYHAALPVALRHGKAARCVAARRWRLTATGAEALSGDGALNRAPRQRALLQLLVDEGEGLGAEAINAVQEQWRPTMTRLVEKGWVEEHAGTPETQAVEADEPPELNGHQRQAVAGITAATGFSPFLLDGVTGSGKTEVYLQAIAQTLARGEQALVLVPEIGLTPQLLERFRRRFALPIVTLHSGLAEGERLCAWLAAAQGKAPLVIGTRSAVFTPLKRLGLIVVDEEHDGSYKQQDGFRYSARDVALMRAKLEEVPIVLGSATPSLETLANVQQGRFAELRLPQRAGAARPPQMVIQDLRHLQVEDGVSAPLLSLMRRHLEADGQVLLFLNRRGYAPTLICHDCGWVADCKRCDVHMTLYAGDRRLRCHHCGIERPVPPQCPECGSVDLRPLGQGTERVEQALARLLPEYGAVRIDRDSTRRKGALEGLLDEVNSGRAQILIGTQMLAKGHHFPHVTLVAILDADQGLYSVDFRAGERLAQLIVQVAGRAGRAERPGTVLIQTHLPDHPLLLQLVSEGYPAFAAAVLAERREAAMPPYSHLALLRAEATDAEAPQHFLEAARQQAERLGYEGVYLLGPAPAPMERRAGRSRAQLLLQADSRTPLHRLLAVWLPLLEGLAEGRRVRWSLDVDPADMY